MIKILLLLLIIMMIIIITINNNNSIIIKITINSNFHYNSMLLILYNFRLSTLHTYTYWPLLMTNHRVVTSCGRRGVEGGEQDLCSLGPGGSPCCARSPAGCYSPSNTPSSVSSGAPRLHQLFSAPSSSSSGGGGRTSSGVPPTIHVDFPPLLPPRRDEDEVRLFFLFLPPNTFCAVLFQWTDGVFVSASYLCRCSWLQRLLCCVVVVVVPLATAQWPGK